MIFEALVECAVFLMESHCFVFNYGRDITETVGGGGGEGGLVEVEETM